MGPFRGSLAKKNPVRARYKTGARVVFLGLGGLFPGYSKSHLLREKPRNS